jgi:hypothetical protein
MTLRLNGSTSGYVELDSPAVGGNNTLVLPTANGTSGQVLTTNGSGALSWTGMGPAFNANNYNSGSQTISNNTQTKVSLGQEAFDTNSCFDSSLSRFTPNVAGYYQITGHVQYTGTTGSGFFVVFLAKNGALLELAVGTPTQFFRQTASQLFFLNGSTDFVEMYCSQGTGSSQTIASAYLQGFLARPA